MAVIDVLKNWLLKLDELRAWITPLLPDFSIGPGEKQAVLEWVTKYVTQTPSDFSLSWRDGILLCELADKFSPDLFHGHGILDPKNCVHNVSLALEIIKGSFGIEPDVTPEDIVICAPEAESKLISLLLKLKERVESDKIEDLIGLTETSSDEEESPDSIQDESFAQGSGLIIGFLGRKASFIVFSNGPLSDPDLVVEIKGPDDTHCCQRITSRSPKTKSELSQSGTPRPTISQCGRSRSQSELWSVQEIPKRDPKVIPLEYEINDDFISVAYTPLKTGIHAINIIWRGRYVTGSPFVAMVEDSLDVQGKKGALLKPPILRKEVSETSSEPRKHSVKFKEPETNKVKHSNVRSRRVLRYIVKIGQKDVVVEAENSEMLAPALQKLDLPHEGSFLLGPRRNSWGFVGDVHSIRRKSLTRQVGIDDSEEDPCRATKRSFSVDVSLTSDPKQTDAAFPCLHPCPNARVNSVAYESASNNSSAPDFDKENSSISSKLPRLETVSEHLSSCTSGMGEETDDKVISSEDEVFYKEQPAFVSSTSNLTIQSVFPAHYTSEVFYEINSSDPAERNTEQTSEPPPTARITEETYEASPDSSKVKGKSVSKTKESDSLENVLHETTVNKQCTHEELRIGNPPPQKNTSMVCTPKGSENLSSKEGGVSAESGQRPLPETITENCPQSDLELDEDEDFNADVCTFGDEAQEILATHAYFTKENKMLVSEVNTLDSYDQTANEADKYYDEKAASPLGLCDRGHVLGKDNWTLQLKDEIDVTVNGSDVKEWNAGHIAGYSRYCDTNNFQDVSFKQNMTDKTISTEERYVPKAVTSIMRTNMGRNDGMQMSDCHSKHDRRDQNFLSEVQWKNFQEQLDKNGVTMMPSENDPEECSLDFSSHEVVTSGKESSDRSELELPVECQECFRFATKPTRSESTLKFSKARRMLSHPYLKHTYHKAESAALSQVPYLSGEKDTQTPDLEDTDNGEPTYFSELRRYSENSFCENLFKNCTEAKNLQTSFTWPTGFSNLDKKSVLHSENMRVRLPESNGNSFDESVNKVSVPKPSVRDSLKFSLRSYKDKYRSEYEEEVVPSNLVKEIVKDFHSRSLEYPTPQSDKVNDIYSRRSFFPPLASNEGRRTVKNRISKWEKFPSMPENSGLAPESNKSSIRDKLSLYVNVQSKVAFWETAYHTPEAGDIPDKEKPSVSLGACAEKDFKLKDVSAVERQQQDHAGFASVRDSDHAVRREAQPQRDSAHLVTSERTEDSGISDDLLMCLKTSDHKRPPMLLRHRSLSDPCIRTSSTRAADFLSNFEESFNVIPSSLYSSSEENSEEAVSESEDGKDEYIDDEIPDYAAMFLGDYISFTGLLGPERSSLRKEAVTQYLQKLEDKSRHIFDPSLSRPHECRALGVGVHYGLVSINNHFQVLTKGAGRGNLSVSIQGSGRHDVTKIIVTYCRKDVYDVVYQVLEPGYYIISVRWSDWSIPGSPFICKVTY